MKNDPVVEEVRRHRKEIEKACGDDPKEFYRHILEVQKTLSDRLVTPGKIRCGGKKTSKYSSNKIITAG